MSDLSDSSLARTVTQVQSSENSDSAILHSREVLINRLLMWLVSIVESQSMRTLESRLSLLVCGGWLPGKADMTTIAALTNKAERTVETVVKGRPRFKVGQTAYYPLAEIAVPSGTDADDSEAPEVAPVKRTGKKKS